MSRRSVLLAFGVAAAAALPLLWVINARTRRPQHTESGTDPVSLPACPASPNCVCSQDADPAHGIEALSVPAQVPESDAFDFAVDRLARLPGAHLVRRSNRYAHFEFRTRLLRFVDDVELLGVAGTRTVHVRSASRLGYSDLGTNRRRIEGFRRALAG